ncbi:MAG TPA: hypothetical protein VGY98_12870 [Verrucomicrobiae bacterium]|nr:hypothetical protein [Verrucomicrobiae bacterium]
MMDKPDFTAAVLDFGIIFPFFAHLASLSITAGYFVHPIQNSGDLAYHPRMA